MVNGAGNWVANGVSGRRLSLLIAGRRAVCGRERDVACEEKGGRTCVSAGHGQRRFWLVGLDTPRRRSISKAREKWWPNRTSPGRRLVGRGILGDRVLASDSVGDFRLAIQQLCSLCASEHGYSEPDYTYHVSKLHGYLISKLQIIWALRYDSCCLFKKQILRYIGLIFQL
jgi:hypothetical protein